MEKIIYVSLVPTLKPWNAPHFTENCRGKELSGADILFGCINLFSRAGKPVIYSVIYPVINPGFWPRKKGRGNIWLKNTMQDSQCHIIGQLDYKALSSQGLFTGEPCLLCFTHVVLFSPFHLFNDDSKRHPQHSYSFMESSHWLTFISRSVTAKYFKVMLNNYGQSWLRKISWI